MLDEGVLRLIGRQKAVFIANARKLSLEQIEAPIRAMRDVHCGLAVAVSVRQPGSSVEELAVFFVPVSDEPDAVDLLCDIVRTVARTQALAVKHLVPMSAEEFPVTAAGKIHRDRLADDFERGVLILRALQPGCDRVSEACDLGDIEMRLATLWKDILMLKELPGRDADFFEHGGDPFASAQLFSAVDDLFDLDIDADAFVSDPTIAGLSRLLADADAVAPKKKRLPN